MTVQSKVTLNLKGLENFTQQMAETYRARVGILGGHEQRGEGIIDNVTLGITQMFGSITKNIPARDFLTLPIELNKREILNQVSSSRMVKSAIEANDAKKVYQILGAIALSFVLEGFATRGFGQWAPNKPSTIARKGSDSPLIHTGQLRRAQTSDVVKKGQAQ
jgi:phage gpG-like protein